MRYLFSFFFWCFCCSVLSQDQLPWGVQLKPKFGFLAGKDGDIGGLPQRHAVAGEISFFWQTNGNKKWHKTYNYPILGVTFFSASVGNREVLGMYTGSYGFIDFPFLKKNKKYQLSGKVGGGLAYTNKVFDQELNPKNTVVSTHLNTLICFGLQNRFSVGRHHLSLGVDLTHCSNGSYKLPNLGINMPFVSVGYGCTMTGEESKNVEKSTLPFRKNLYGILGFLSANEIRPTGQGRSPVYGISLFSRRFFKPKVGAELSVDIVSKQIIFKYHPDIPKTQIDVIQVGCYAGYLLPLDRFHFVLGMGCHVVDKYQPEGLFYHRIGVRYYFDFGLHLNAVLRSNWASADFTEWGIGYTFNYKSK
jgi:hypothetical protein